MEQSVMVFGGTAARASAIPTPSEGMTSYRTDTQQIESYDGAEWRGMSGLQLIKKQTVGTAVSTVVVTSAFSATYENYLIIWSGALGSANGSSISLTFNNSAGSTYNHFGGFGSYGSNTLTNSNAASATGILVALNSTVANSLNTEIAVRNPFNTSVTTVSARSSGSVYAYAAQGYDSNSASQTGFSITVGGATFTGGTIYVYGYGV